MKEEVKLGIYKHFKGNLFLVIGIAKHSETEELMVVYIDLYDNPAGQIWIRPLSLFTGYKLKVKIICPKHSIFEQRASDHIEGCGCPSCKTSKGEERIIKFLKKE